MKRYLPIIYTLKTAKAIRILPVVPADSSGSYVEASALPVKFTLIAEFNGHKLRERIVAQ
jgi:hypothetical protein